MPYARITDPETSHEAASSVSNISATQEMILFCLRWEDMTDERLAREFRKSAPEYKVSDSGLRSRRSELVDRGFVCDTGKREKTESGRSTIVWGLVKTTTPTLF